ncbi:hypothetical protein KIPB_003972 [Kipferlia bialata]|uniref:Ig-like domain-containing protein n=1 Tax=Kipferlia bialata TaxID=797122 RepID=A0A9K3CUQ5_9EUKA|nr:hypothetical protein KIPB_003972 [Kipferlia bialata]|eukprot:g3972.t1
MRVTSSAICFLVIAACLCYTDADLGFQLEIVDQVPSLPGLYVPILYSAILVDHDSSPVVFPDGIEFSVSVVQASGHAEECSVYPYAENELHFHCLYNETGQYTMWYSASSSEWSSGSQRVMDTDGRPVIVTAVIQALDLSKTTWQGDYALDTGDDPDNTDPVYVPPVGSAYVLTATLYDTDGNLLPCFAAQVGDVSLAVDVSQHDALSGHVDAYESVCLADVWSDDGTLSGLRADTAYGRIVLTMDVFAAVPHSVQILSTLHNTQSPPVSVTPQAGPLSVLYSGLLRQLDGSLGMSSGVIPCMDMPLRQTREVGGILESPRYFKQYISVLISDKYGNVPSNAERPSGTGVQSSTLPVFDCSRIVLFDTAHLNAANGYPLEVEPVALAGTQLKTNVCMLSVQESVAVYRRRRYSAYDGFSSLQLLGRMPHSLGSAVPPDTEVSWYMWLDETNETGAWVAGVGAVLVVVGLLVGVGCLVSICIRHMANVSSSRRGQCSLAAVGTTPRKPVPVGGGGARTGAHTYVTLE